MYGIQNGSNTIWLQLNAIILYLLPLLNDTPMILWYYIRGAKQGVGWGCLNPPWILDGGVEHLSTPPDFEKIYFRGGWLPLNWFNYIVYVFLST